MLRRDKGGRHGGTTRLPAGRAYRWLLISQGLASTGQTLGLAAVSVAVYRVSESTAWVALAASAQFLPSLALSGAAGALVDRSDRIALLAKTHWLRALAVLALGLAVLLSLPAALMLTLVVAGATLGTPTYPALMATTRDLVAPDELVGATSAVATVDNAAFVAGPALGGALLIVGSPAAVLILNALLFAGAWACASQARSHARDVVQARELDDEKALGGQMREAVEAITRFPAVAVPVLLLFTLNLLYGLTIVLLVPVAASVLGTGETGVGALNLAIGIGTFAALLLTRRLAGRESSLLVHGLGLAVTGIPFAVLAGGPGPSMAFALMVLSGGASMVAEVLATSWVQRSIPGRLVGRVFGLLESLMIGAVLLGSWLAPVLARAAGLRAAVAIVGVALPAVALAAAGSLHQRGRTTAGALVLDQPIGAGDGVLYPTEVLP